MRFDPKFGWQIGVFFLFPSGLSSIVRVSLLQEAFTNKGGRSSWFRPPFS